MCTANGLWAGVAYMGSYGKRDSQLVSGRVLMDFTVDALINITDPGWKMPGVIAAKHRFRINSILRASLSALPTLSSALILTFNTFFRSGFSGGNLWDCLGAG